MLVKLFAFVLAFGIGAEKAYPIESFFIQQEVDTLKVVQLLDEADIFIKNSQYAEARKKIDQAGEWAEELDFSKGKQLTALRMAEVYLSVQFFDSARVVLENALEDFPESDYKIQLYNLLATAYRYMNELDKAIETYQMVLELAEENGRYRMIAAIHQNMGVAYINMGKKAEGLNSFLFSIEYAEQEKDTAFLAVAYNNLGDTYNNFGDYEQAEFYLQKSYELAVINNLRSDLLRVTINLANLKGNLEEFDDALQLYQQALDLSKEVRPNTPPFRILYNLGNLYLKMESPDEAILYLEESLDYCIQLNIPPGIYYNYGGLGDAANQKGQLTEAIRRHKQALEVAMQMGSLPFIQETRLKLYELNKEVGNFESALIQFEEYEAISDSMLDLEQERSFAELENRLELNRQTEINALLEEKQLQQEKKLQFQLWLIITAAFVIILILYILYTINQASKEKTKAYNQLAEQREELEKLNQEMNKLFAIIAHDLRAPLASMHGILFLLKNGDLSKDEIVAYTDEIEGNVQKNIDVMEDLLSWAKRQMTGITFVKEELNIHELVNEVIGKQESRYKGKNISVTNKVNKSLSIQTDENALKLILRNLLSNSIKFTDHGGSINFSSSDKEDEIQLCVIDTGIGMSEDLQERVFSNRSISFSLEGTKGEKGTGFGLSLIKEFVDKLGGSITIESEEGKGTKFCIDLPKE